jgi:hypothetical protein
MIRQIYTLIVAISFIPFFGCSFLPHRIHTKSGTDVTAVRDAESPTTVTDGSTVETVPIPKGSRITITETPAMPATAQAPAEPAKKVTEVVFSADSAKRIETKNTAVSLAPSRKPDTSVAIHAEDNQERRIFLWATLAFGVAAGALAYFQLLGVAKIAGIAAGASIAIYVVLGHQELILWVLGFIVMAVVIFVLYTEWRKGKLNAAASLATGTVNKLVQSVEEFTKDNPVLGKDLKQNYIAPNADDAHKAVISAAKTSMDPSYLAQPPDPTHIIVTPTPAVTVAPQTPA